VDTTTPSNGPELIAQGQDLYWVNCAGCHQYEGQGWRRLYPNLAGNPIVTLHDASPLVETVLNGQGSMPGFRGQLSSDEIAAVLSYIRNAWGNTADPVSPKQVK
jgi:mono/diheme cytochrome c family protein